MPKLIEILKNFKAYNLLKGEWRSKLIVIKKYRALTMLSLEKGNNLSWNPGKMIMMEMISRMLNFTIDLISISRI